jgi:hypothetical protein
LPLFQQLLFNAYDYHFYGDYRLAVIEAGTAFEIFIENFIKDLYSKLGKNESSIDKILEAGLKNLLECHIKILGNNTNIGNPKTGKAASAQEKINATTPKTGLSSNPTGKGQK